MNTVQKHTILQVLLVFINSTFHKAYYIEVPTLLFTLILFAYSDTDTLHKPAIS